jgi:hypothetical protein
MERAGQQKQEGAALALQHVLKINLNQLNAPFGHVGLMCRP